MAEKHDGHTANRAGQDRRANPPSCLHAECQMFTTEESRVAVREMMKLATPCNIQLVSIWLNRLNEAEKSEWKTKIKLLKLAALASGAIIIYHLFVDIKFFDWAKRYFVR
jgi:hypothetical protein